MDVKVTINKTFIINGKRYHSIDEMPPDVRQAYESSIATQGSSGPLSTQQDGTTRIIFNGHTYSSPDEIPQEARQLYEMAMAASKQGGPHAMTAQKDECQFNISIGPVKFSTKGRGALLVGAVILLIVLAYLAHSLISH